MAMAALSRLRRRAAARLAHSASIAIAVIRRQRCDACKRRAPSKGNWLLGCDDKLCHDCFTDWYDNGITRRSEMHARRQAGIAP